MASHRYKIRCCLLVIIAFVSASLLTYMLVLTAHARTINVSILRELPFLNSTNDSIVNFLWKESIQNYNTSLKPTTVHVATSLPFSVCREIDHPGGEKNVSINVNETSISDVEEMIFQTSTLKVRKLVTTADSLVKKLYATPHGLDRPTVEETLADALVFDDYIYVPGGRWVPKNCLPKWKVAIIIPFRNRFVHLPILLKHLIPFLQSQHLEFGIYVTEQANELEFNRAMLMNVGFVESLNFTRWDCFIFHDVDHIPLNYTNYYGCSHMPRHFLSGVDRWGYKLLYSAFFGAVTGFTRTQIERFNGFPNVYWGWGGEDDDILYRIRKLGFSKTRPKGRIGFYTVIKHHHASAKKNDARVCLLRHFSERVNTDGLSNLVYSKPNVTLFPLYINISVDIQYLEWNKKWKDCTGRNVRRKLGPGMRTMPWKLEKNPKRTVTLSPNEANRGAKKNQTNKDHNLP